MMRRFILACVLTASAALAQAAALPPETASAVRANSANRIPSDPIIVAQNEIRAYSGSRQARPRPAYRHQGHRPPTAYRPGYRGGYPGYRPGYRYGHRPGYPPPVGWRPAYPGWRPGWAPAPWYGSYWRPGYGWAAAAGLIAVGVLAASAAAAYAVPPPPNPGSCWFYTDETYQTGYWAPCPPAP